MHEQPYREAEERLWAEVGVVPVEHRVHLHRNDVEVRLQETGSGPTVVFLHGGPGGAGSQWASLAARLPDFRCLLLDRPGTGLSDPQPLADAAAVRRQSESMLVDLLDALDLERAHVVGSSHGSHVALLSAAAHPDRVERTVHLGCPGFVEGMTLTAADRLILLPGVAALFGRLPAGEKSLRKTLGQLGHSSLLEAGGPSPATLQWYLALQHHTPTMRHEFAAMAAMGTFRGGFDPALDVGPDILATVRSPSYYLWGEHDVYGDESVARAVVDAMPVAQLEMMPGAGHLPWLDDPDHVAAVIRRHLTG
jgi:2-hydroxy-6-oxonona-2,4-dienedioate hydrolase